MNSAPFSHTADTATTPAPDAIATAATTPRLAPYRFIHKGLRALMFSTLQSAGALDASVPAQRRQIVDEVERLLATCADHVAHENQFFHEALRERAPRAVLPFHEDHLDHVAAISDQHLLLQRLRDASDEQAPVLAYELFLRLSVFIGENLEHMAEEESTLTQALWAHFSDAELAAIEEALHAALAPQEMAFYLQWMARGLNASEMAALLQGAQPTLPPEAFEQVVAVARSEMPAERWVLVAAATGLAA